MGGHSSAGQRVFLAKFRCPFWDSIAKPIQGSTPWSGLCITSMGLSFLGMSWPWKRQAWQPHLPPLNSAGASALDFAFFYPGCHSHPVTTVKISGFCQLTYFPLYCFSIRVRRHASSFCPSRIFWDFIPCPRFFNLVSCSRSCLWNKLYLHLLHQESEIQIVHSSNIFTPQSSASVLFKKSPPDAFFF